MSIQHEYPERPKEGEKLTPAKCTKKERCAMMSFAMAGSKGSEVGLTEAWVMDKGYQTQMAYRLRIANEGRAKKYTLLFIEHCPFCGAKLYRGMG